MPVAGATDDGGRGVTTTPRSATPGNQPDKDSSSFSTSCITPTLKTAVPTAAYEVVGGAATWATIWSDTLTTLATGARYAPSGDDGVLAFYVPAHHDAVTITGIAYVTEDGHHRVTTVAPPTMLKAWGPQTCPDSFGSGTPC